MNNKLCYPTCTLVLAVLLLVSQSVAQDRFQSDIPDAVSAQLEEAKLLRQKGQINPAIEKLNAIIASCPDYYMAYYNLALAYSTARDYQKAVAAFNKALDIRDRKKVPEATIFNTMGVMYMYAGDYPNAELMLKKAEQNVDLLPGKSRGKLFNNLGVYYFNAGKYPESEKYFRIASTRYASKSAKDNIKILEKIKSDVADMKKK